jgi:hypothetical protein
MASGRPSPTITADDATNREFKPLSGVTQARIARAADKREASAKAQCCLDGAPFNAKTYSRLDWSPIPEMIH